MLTNLQINEEVYWQTDRQIAARQTDRQTDRQIDEGRKDRQMNGGSRVVEGRGELVAGHDD